MEESIPLRRNMDDLLSVLSEVGSRPAEVVSDTHAANGLVRLIVRSDASISVEIDPNAAEDARHADEARAAGYPASTLTVMLLLIGIGIRPAAVGSLCAGSRP